MKNTSIIATSLLVASATTATANNIQPSITIDVNDIELTTSGEIKYYGELHKFNEENSRLRSIIDKEPLVASNNGICIGNGSDPV